MVEVKILWVNETHHEGQSQYCSLKKNSVRSELVEGFFVSSWWFDKLTPRGCENLCEATNG